MARSVLRKLTAGFPRIQKGTDMSASDKDLHTQGLQRRKWLQKAAGATAGIALGSSMLGRALAAETLTIGVIYVGPRGDFGWNQSHAVGVEILKKLPGVKVVE